MEKKYNFAAISGSLRKGSYNTMVLKAAQKLAPENITIEQLSIDEVPYYNFDLHEKQFPDAVEMLNDKIKAADAVILVTPEYNYSVSGVLKNAIDFFSRSPKKPFDMKPVGLMGATPGMMGTVRAQYQLRQMMIPLNAYVMNRPEIMISQAHTKFDEEGNLIDIKTTEFIENFIASLAAFSDIFQKQ
ncbi:MAG: NAD(P)H-dependent oxidoreductase [Ignavibacteria bacterium]|nr:NAD(P)H-dependent oxidoreductase [Ignavibacteria bacterium]